MDGGEFLQTSHAPEPEHRPLPSSERQVRVLRSVVRPASGFLPIRRTQVLQRRAVGAQLVCHENLYATVLIHRFSEEFQSRLLVPGLRDEALQDLALVIDSPPKVMPLPVDLHEDLIEMPPPVAGFHALDTAFADLRGEHRAEPIPPEPHRLVADVDAAFVQKILHVAERQGKSDVQHHRQTDDFRAAVKALERVRFDHVPTLRGRPARLNRNPSDSALAVDLHEDLVEVPTPAARFHSLDAPPSVVLYDDAINTNG